MTTIVLIATGAVMQEGASKTTLSTSRSVLRVQYRHLVTVSNDIRYSSDVWIKFCINLIGDSQSVSIWQPCLVINDVVLLNVCFITFWCALAICPTRFYYYPHTPPTLCYPTSIYLTPKIIFWRLLPWYWMRFGDIEVLGGSTSLGPRKLFR